MLLKDHSAIQDKAECLFKKIMNNQQINSLSDIQNHSQFLNLCSLAGTLFFRRIKKKPNLILTFLVNYHNMVLHIHSQSSGHNDQANENHNKQYQIGSLINNISLHFILLASYNLLETGNQSAAKDLLKKSLNYIDSHEPDPILLATALSNFCLIMIRRGKYYKSLPYLIRAIQILDSEIFRIKKNNQIQKSTKKQMIVEVSVFLVNGYINLSKCLGRIIEKNNKQIYRNLLENTNRIGLQKSLKYLGKNSQFTKKFFNQIQYQTSVNIFHLSIPLPVYRVQKDEQQIPEGPTPEEKIMEELSKIYLLLKQAKKQPQIVYVEQKQEPKKQPEYEIGVSEELVGKLTFLVQGWSVQAQILRDKSKQKIGTLVLDCKRGTDRIYTVVQEKKMLKILSLINYRDVLPYQFDIWSMTAQQFIKYCIMNFLFIDDNKNLQFFPRSLGFTNPFSINLLNRKCYVFINHIKSTHYRLAICPTDNYTTFHLDIDFQPSFIDEMIELTEKMPKNLTKIYEQLMKQSLRNQNSQIKSDIQQSDELKILNLKNQSKFIGVIDKILMDFEKFIMQKNMEEDTEILQKQQEYFKFLQSEKNIHQGRFYYLKYNDKIQAIQVYVQNTFITYGIEGKCKSKGSSVYYIEQISTQFGIMANNVKILFQQNPYQPLKIICDIICRKYLLKFYQNPLSLTDMQTFQQNSIVENKLTFKTYFRKMVLCGGYFSPLTLSLVSVNNILPVGIRISLYDPIICSQAGYFIYIYAGAWKWPPQAIIKKNQYDDILYNIVQEYTYKKDYFLVEWLERIGFRKIFSLAKVNDNGDLQMDGLNPCFDRIDNVLRIISS